MSFNETQLAAIQAPPGPLAILAGPGSGKTATLAARIAYLTQNGLVDPSKSLALCHTTKAAGELSDRIARFTDHKVSCSTVHAAAWRLVKKFHTQAGLPGTPRLDPNMFMPVARSCDAALVKTEGKVDKSVILDVLSEIDWARARLVSPKDYVKAANAANRSPGVDLKDVKRVFEHFMVNKQVDVLDFADVLEQAFVLSSDTSVAVTIAAGIDFLFVDEYQDIDPSQQRLIDAWLSGSDRLCVVGDVDQAIFGFKGGDPSLLESFPSRYQDAQVVSLLDNYRSSPQIVSWVNSLASSSRPSLRSACPSGPTPEVLASPSESLEEKALVAQLKAWSSSGVSFDEMAVLFRFNAESARLEAVLLDAAIPYHVAGTDRFFDRDEVLSVLKPFGRLARENPDVNGLELLCDTALSVGYDLDSPPAGAGMTRQRFEAVAALVSLVEDSMASLSARYVLEGLQDKATSSHDLTPGGVTLATVHAAKGLEWDCVWVVGCVEGKIPSSFASTPTALLEERRVFYVAVSRARSHLVVSHAERRHNKWSNKPSRFLDLLPTVALSPPATSPSKTNSPPRGGTRVGECTVCSNRLTSPEARQVKKCSGPCLTGAPRQRWDLLVAWRTERASVLHCSPPKVASDRALFRAAVKNSSRNVSGFSASGGPPPL